MAGRISLDSRGLRPPPLQTSFNRPTTAPHSGVPTAAAASNTAAGPPAYSSTTSSHSYGSSTAQHRRGESAQLPEASSRPPLHHSHQRFVLTDPLAFKYLEEDPSTTVLERRKELQGYECYIVEQWSTSRSHPTFTITTYTGDPTQSVQVGVLSVPTDESTWSPRLRVYFKALNQYHAKRRETPLGILMVTNLSGFPSSLTVIPVPDGDIGEHRLDFLVNENLKRLGCSGRVGLTLAPPSGATIAKFHQLYRTSEKNDLYKSVIELVRLCQSALMLFDKLEIDYADGLLCDVTERAINDWWLDMGSEHYNVEPHDGILGPTTMSGLLGLLMGARNRLHAANCPVAKDAFDVEAMKKGISSFQKQHRLPRTRRLDRRTLDRLQRSTIKAANSEGWTVPKAVKSTVAELSGRGGEMIVDAVGRRDRAGIAEIETTDIDRFIQLVYGERPKWLWYARPTKKTARTGGDAAPPSEGRPALTRDLTFRQDEHGGFTWTARKSVGDGLMMAGVGQENDLTSPVNAGEDDQERSKGTQKRPAPLKETKSGFGRFKGAVGLGHQRQHSKNESPQSPASPQSPSEGHRHRPLVRRAQTSPVGSPTSQQSPAFDRPLAAPQQQETIPEDEDDGRPSFDAASYQSDPRTSKDSLAPPSYRSNREDNLSDIGSATDVDDGDSHTLEPSVGGDDSVYNDEVNDVLPTGPETEQGIGHLMQRTVSYSQAHASEELSRKSDAGYPRHLSFSLAEESLLTWTSIFPQPRDDEDAKDPTPLALQLQEQTQLATSHRILRQEIKTLSTTTAPFTTASLSHLSTLLAHLSDGAPQIESQTLTPHAEASNSLHTAAEAVLRSEREQLEEGGKGLETLRQRLEYEVGSLRGRVGDVEQGVREFEGGVGRVEERVRELEREEEHEREGWSGWCVMM